MRNRIPVVCVLVGLTIPLGPSCATERAPAVERVWSQYREAADSPNLAALAPVRLEEARRAAERLERAASGDASEATINHLAYLAERRIELARTAAEERGLQHSVEQLARRRDDLRLKARTTELEQAREQAETLGREVDQARTEANQSERDAARLQTELDGLRSRLQDVDARETPRGIVLTLEDVVFAVDGATLAPGARNDLDRIADFLKSSRDRQVRVEGHTDSTGSASYNLRLSERRAHAVADYLESRGVNRDRLAVRGLGERLPIAPNDNLAGRQQNRRVEIVIPPRDGPHRGTSERTE